jgi:hypothetical protein
MRTNDSGASEPSLAEGSTDASTLAPALVVSAPSGTATDEMGTQVTFTVKLATKPTSRVTVPLLVSRTDEASLDSTELVFDETSFDVPRTVTVTGKDDLLADGDQPFTVEIGPARGSGSGYEGVPKKSLAFVNQDDDTAGFQVGAAGSSVTEKGSSTTFTVRLRTQPTGDVTVPVKSSDPGEGVTDVTSLVFGPADWNVTKSVQVTGVDDDLDDGDVTYGIVLGKALSTDAAYSGLDPVDPSVTTLDDDAAALVLGTPSGLRTNELGTQVTFEVHLAAEPTSPVTVPIVSSDTTEATVSPSSLVFGPADWKTPRTVTVTGVADATADGAQPYKVRLGPSTSVAATFAGLVGEVSLVNDVNPLSAYVDYSINHLLASGQSNSTANGGTRNDDNQGAPQFQFTPAHPTYSNLMFDTGVFVALGCSGGGCAASTVRTPVSFVPIAEGDRFLNYAVETLSSAMANRISALATGSYLLRGDALHQARRTREPARPEWLQLRLSS